MMRSSIHDKWQRLMNNSGLTDTVQDLIPKAGNACIVKPEERRIARAINQLISGNSNLSYMLGKMTRKKSELCENCKVEETINHYMYDCESYEEDRRILERDIERILAAYDLQHISDINLKVMTGNSEEASRAAKFESGVLWLVL